ncbi:hypothetical protein HYU21_00425 [Candidatus Woesearchaeota archaeon]|nr:hypothetical protein [Candidatus Woesearchaeota archaeon]
MAKKTRKKLISKSDNTKRVKTLSLKNKPKLIDEQLKPLNFVFGFVSGIFVNILLFSYPIPLFLMSLPAKFDTPLFIGLLMVLIFALETFILFRLFNKRKYLAIGIWSSIILFLVFFGLLILACKLEVMGFCRNIGFF